MKVLLIGDIGGFPQGYAHIKPPVNYTHIGDEAMMLATYHWYTHSFPQFALTTLSWKHIYRLPSLRTQYHFVWPTEKLINRLYFFPFLIKLILWKHLQINHFSSKEYKFVKLIDLQDVIHFTGGGNLTSLYPSWLYYSLFVISAGRILGKKVVLASQTVGPFKPIDALTFWLIVRAAHYVGLRKPLNLQKSLFSRWFPNMKPMLDSAYSYTPTKRGQSSPIFRIGISIHSWKNFNDDYIVRLATSIMKSISVTEHCEVIYIPHILSSNKDMDDYRLYVKMKQKLPKNFPFHYGSVSKNREKSVAEVKSLTSSCDLVLTTRYHGVIFALSTDVPVIALSYDSYYTAKHRGALSFIYGKNLSHYLIRLKKNTPYDDIMPKITCVLKNIRKEKEILRRYNQNSSTPSLKNLTIEVQPNVISSRFMQPAIRTI
ncbi:MAG: polysaccharide pyruvyl transferase family protein [bacterium]|nr:polysaccharide pyruvyl transferase family protein [bacterium]